MCTLNQHEAACEAFERALKIDGNDVRATYNLADALDELGRAKEAAHYWRDYLQCDMTSERAAHARRRLRHCG